MKQYLSLALCLFLSLSSVLFSTLSFAVESNKPRPDFSGIWIPVANLSEGWGRNDLTLTEAAKEKLQIFDKQKHDSTLFCMPFGSPRNTLNTAPYPMEILQTDNQITLVFDRLGDIRRFFLDGRSHPEDPIPSWMGHATASWNNNTLRTNTIAMTAESILNEDGLPHSESMLLEESFEFVIQEGKTYLQYEMELTDKVYYQKPLLATRYFARSPLTEMSEGSGLCILDQWRHRLEEINRNELRTQLKTEEN